MNYFYHHNVVYGINIIVWYYIVWPWLYIIHLKYIINDDRIWIYYYYYCIKKCIIIIIYYYYLVIYYIPLSPHACTPMIGFPSTTHVIIVINNNIFITCKWRSFFLLAVCTLTTDKPTINEWEIKFLLRTRRTRSELL